MKEHRTTEGRDGGTNFILRIKEQETHLTLQEHDDDDDDDEVQKCTEDKYTWWYNHTFPDRSNTGRSHFMPGLQ